ncbi:MAG: hypothetical protein ACE37K_05485 [Planctomycetota bacterium]
MTRTLPVATFRGLSLVLFAALLSGCGAFDYTADLATNELFYADVPFVTKAPGDVPVFVAPIKDERDGSVLPLHERGFPIQYGTDDFWERPVADMISEVLDRQLERSELFGGFVDQATPETIILKPSLVMFTVGAKEGMAGSLTFAEVGLRIEVLGPAAADGERPLWHDHVYGNRQRTELQVKPVSPYRLIGRALQITMSNAMSGLDGSNVARSNVPVEIVKPAAAEASADKR